MKEANLFVRSQYNAHIGETKENTKKFEGNKLAPIRNKRKTQRFSEGDKEEIFNLIDG